MLSFSDHKRIVNTASTLSKARRQDSHIIFDQTFAEDPAYRYCYIYDYFHDDQPDLAIGMTYENTTKTGIDCKYLVTQYNTLSKDQVEYHILFRRGQEPLSYYREAFGKNAEFPVGLYIDIPDENDIYRKWLICARDMEPDFVKYSVLPCTYQYHWVKRGKTYKMWAVPRSQNSYNSGVWQDFRSEKPENQIKAWFPKNILSDEIFYNDRFIISDLIPEPISWRVTKVETISPFGINKLTFAQDKFNPNTDYINTETGEMYANYYTDRPIDDHIDSINIALEYIGDRTLKVGGSKRMIHIQSDSQISPTQLNWSFTINGKDVNELIDFQVEDSSTVSVRFLGDDDYLMDTLLIKAKGNIASDEIEVMITAL